MIIETLVTTKNQDGSLNLAPMGPTYQGSWERFELRPFDSSTTLANLQRTGEGILHITDNARMMALAAIGGLRELPPGVAGKRVDVMAIQDACCWFEFKVDFIELTGPRANVSCRTVHQHRQRDFLGFNRARHAVVEAAILATRINFLPAEEVAAQYRQYRALVNKTGGPEEIEAMTALEQFVFSQGASSPATK
jgi:hypothetical protein